MDKSKVELMAKICERAEKLGIVNPKDARWERMLDLEFADRQFNLRLEEFLNADEENFCHDWIGIWKHMDRRTCKIGDLFVPRFAGKESVE